MGPDPPTPGARAFAERLVAAVPDPPGRRPIFIGHALSRWEQPVGAIVARPHRGARDRAQAFLHEAVPMLAIVLERDDLLTRSAGAERTLLAPSERRLSRLGLDLHDGPLQDLAVLGGELRLLRGQLGRMLSSDDERRLVRGRVDDLEAHLVALEADLREVCNSLQSPYLLQQSFPDAVADVAESHSSSSGVTPRVRLSGQLTALGESVELTLIAVIRESLNNARKHGGASEVSVSVTGRADRVEAEVRDNGRGFEVERTLVRAARAGHLGLAGLHERVRILGGQARVDSAPGGPTVISVVLPRVEPVSVMARNAQPAG